METIKYKNIAKFFNNRVTIDEICEFGDTRGFVCELWRSDDDQYNSLNPISENNTPEMCYYSCTNPLIMRGPHEHEYQTDWFITSKSKMVYMFVDEHDKCKHFFTQPDKMYRIKVEPGIIHSYRNLDILTQAQTMNFPNKLFKGHNKENIIDEIRHEPKLEDNKNIYILGSDGRLGKAITKILFNDMKMHQYNVIPINDIFNNNPDGIGKLNKFFELITNENTRKSDDIIINCIGLTNVQCDNDDFLYSNFLLPKFLTEFCINNNFHLIHFSTDYVYQKGELSPYTKSKLEYENWLETLYSDEKKTHLISALQKYTHIVRVANLFSLSELDKHNAINKLWNASKDNKISIPENLIVMLTDVEVLSQFLSTSYIHKIEEYPQFINVSGKPYSIEYIMKEFFEKEIEYSYIDNPKVVNHPNMFINRNHYYMLDCDDQINKKIIQIIKHENL